MYLIAIICLIIKKIKEFKNMDDFEKVVNEAITYWVGKDPNPLTGKTFKEIYDLSLEVGVENIK
jgi:hypothetical protein